MVTSKFPSQINGHNIKNMYIIENTKNNLSATVATKVDQRRIKRWWVARRESFHKGRNWTKHYFDVL